MTITNDDRERRRHDPDHEPQRFAHLVLGRARPRPEIPARPAGLSKQEWRARVLAARSAPGVTLAPGIEERVRIAERWSHKPQGTPETHEHADAASRRPGSIARLYASGAIDDDQLAAAEGIAEAYRMTTAGVAVRTASLEARVDGGRHGRAEEQAFGQILADFAYSEWRHAVGAAAPAVLDVVAHDQGLTIVARRYGMSMPRARRMLTAALDAWWVGRSAARPSARAAAAAQAA